jgi:HEAT repeat protein
LTLVSDDQLDSGDEQLLRAIGLDTDGPALLAFFRKRARPLADEDKIQTLIRQLNHSNLATREKASGELVSLGTAAIPLLRQALKDPDENEIAHRAKRCLEAITTPTLPAAAARLVAQRKPASAAEVLLAYLPFADDEVVLGEVRTALVAVAARDGKLDKTVLAALEDPVPIRRVVAAEVVCQAGGSKQVATVRKLLRDPKPTVRLRIALALAAFREEAAIPVLIASVGELPPAQGKPAEEFLIRLAGEEAPAAPLGTDEAGRQKCREAWAAWWAHVDPNQLLDYFRKRTLADDDRAKIQTLIRQLGDEAFAVREKASAGLAAFGLKAVPLLQQALKSPDVEVTTRAADCLKLLEKDIAGPLPINAARLLAFRKPAGTAEVLLGYLPSAADEAVAEAVRNTLTAVAVQDGKVEPALLRALNDRSPVRRAAAAESLCQAGVNGPAVGKLLQDPQPAVRSSVALALIFQKDKAAVPVLIDLLGELPLAEAGRVEDVLRRLADEQAPAVDLGDSAATRQKCRTVWAEWWRVHGPAVDLNKLDSPRRLGHTLLVEVDPNTTTGRVLELGPDDTPRWQIQGLRYPLDAQVLPGNRVLIAEFYGMQVTERDFRGNVLWRQPVTMPLSCQRLPNGNTFIASRNLLLEVDRSGKELFVHHRSAHDLRAAYKLPDGQIVCLTTGGSCLWLDARGKELHRFAAGSTMYNSVEALPNGRVLVAHYEQNKVVEYNVEGKKIWEASVSTPWSATRLPNGHTLVACHVGQVVVELDRLGKVVWEYRTNARPLKAWRR